MFIQLLYFTNKIEFSLSRYKINPTKLLFTTTNYKDSEKAEIWTFVNKTTRTIQHIIEKLILFVERIQ